MKIALIGCTSDKIQLEPGKLAQAQDLYLKSDWFRKARAWIECLISKGQLDGWAILSAKYGLLFPWDEVETYDETLASPTPMRVVRAWAALTGPQLLQAFGPQVTYYVLAGERYRMALGALPNPLEIPMRGLGIGDQKGWLKRAYARECSKQNPADPRKRKLERGPQDPATELRLAHEQLRQGARLTPRQLELVLREWVEGKGFVDVGFYDRAKWLARGETVGRDAPLTMTAEGTLYGILRGHYDHVDDRRDRREFYDLVRAAGYRTEMGYHWSWHFYPADLVEHAWFGCECDSNPDYAGQECPECGAAPCLVEWHGDGSYDCSRCHRKP